MPRIPLADQMYDVLLRQLMDGSRTPGDPLNIGALSRELNVSQTPLREALARLEHSGLVLREALRGYFVAPSFSARELAKLGAARELIEPAIASESALRRTPEFLAELAVTIGDLRSSATYADTDAKGFRLYWTSAARFHEMIAAQADNPFLESAFRALAGPVQRARLVMKAGQTHSDQAAGEHESILEAIASGDPQAAAHQMLAHVKAASKRALEQHSDPTDVH